MLPYRTIFETTDYGKWKEDYKQYEKKNKEDEGMETIMKPELIRRT